MESTFYCLECGKQITPGVHSFSTEQFGYPLCIKDQGWLANSGATWLAQKLYFALKKKNLPVILEYHDGDKTIDIVLEGQLYIEVDGKHHYEDPDQAFTDLRRTYHALKESIPTIRIPSALIFNDYFFNKTVDSILEICQEFKKAG
jgi:hypothetical protein